MTLVRGDRVPSEVLRKKGSKKGRRTRDVKTLRVTPVKHETKVSPIRYCQSTVESCVRVLPLDVGFCQTLVYGVTTTLYLTTIRGRTTSQSMILSGNHINVCRVRLPFCKAGTRYIIKTGPKLPLIPKHLNRL